jgi:hypothetical protein
MSNWRMGEGGRRTAQKGSPLSSFSWSGLEMDTIVDLDFFGAGE